MLVLEYATHGDLLSYLRDSRVGVQTIHIIRFTRIFLYTKITQVYRTLHKLGISTLDYFPVRIRSHL